MAYTSVRLAVNAGNYHTEMKSAAAQMKELASEYSLTSTKAKLFGSAVDTLKAKAESLTGKVTLQKNIVQMNRAEQERLTEQLGKQKTKQEELKTKVEAAKKAYEGEKKATGENSDATKALKEELDKLEKKFRDNETAIGRTETALSNQTVKVNRSETALVEMQAELEKVNKDLKNHNLNVFSDACDKAGQKIEQFGKKMTIVSTGLAAYATGAGKMAVDFEDSIAKVSTIMDEGVMSVDEMEDAIIGLSNETGIAAGDIADNVYNAISAGQDTGDAVNFVRESTKLATAGFAESGDTLDILTTILNAYGLEAEKVTEVSDMLVQTQNLGKTTVSDLSSAMGKVIPTANANGVALDQLCAGYAIMTANGVATAETTTYINSMLNELGKTGSTTDVILREKTGKSFSELMQGGSSLADVLEVVDGAAKEENLTMSDMFSSAEAAKAGLILLGDSTDSFNGTLKEMRESTGATDTAFEKMQTTSYDIKVAINELKNTTLQFGQTIMSSAAPLVEQFTEKVHELCEWFGELDEGQQQTILKAGLFVAAVGPAAIGIGKFAQGISTTIKTGKKLASGIKALNAVMAANPVMMVVTAVSLLVAGFVALYNNSETFRNAVNKLWSTVKEGFGKIKETILGTLDSAKEKIDEVKNKFLNSEIGQAAVKAFNGVKDTASTVMSAAVDTVKENLDNMKAAYEENGGGINGIVAAGWEGIKGYHTAGFTFIDNLTGGKLSGIKNKFSEKLGAVSDTVKQKWDDIKVSYEEGGGGVSGILEVMFDQQAETIRGAFDVIQNATGINMEGIKEKVITGVQTVRNTVVDATYETQNKVKETLDNMKAAYEENGGGINGIVAAGWEGIKGYHTAGFTFIDNLTGGKLSGIKNKFSEKLGAVSDTVKQKWDDIKVSYEEGGGGVSGILEVMFDQQAETIRGAFDVIQNATGINMEGIKEKVITGVQTVRNTVVDATYETQNKVKETLDNMKAAYEENGGGINGIVAAGWEGIKGYHTAGFTFIDNLTGGKLSEIKSKFFERTSEIKSDWTSKFTEIKNTTTNLMQDAVQNVSAKLDNMKAAYAEKGGGMQGIVAVAFTGIRDTIGSMMEAANILAGGKLENIKSSFLEKLNSAKSTVSSVMNEIRSEFSSKMEAAQSAVSGAIEKIKGFFNFSWSLPHLKMPHPRVSGSFSLNPPSVPHFSIDWYKTGAIMGSPMIFGMNGNTLLAGGEPETGGEAILPLAPFYTKLNDILDRKLSAIQQVQNVYVENHTYIDGDEVSSRTVTKVDAKMVKNRRKGR